MTTFSDGGDVAAMADFDTQGNMRLHLQTLLDNKEKQLQSASTLGHQLLAQREELRERIKEMQEFELDDTGSDDGLDDSWRDKYRELADSIKAWDTENEQLTSVFGSKPVNGIHTSTSRHADTPRGDHERSKTAGAGPSAAQSSRRAKNAAHRADDVAFLNPLQFAFEIGSGLLTEVRRLQSLLGERDKAIQDMKEEKDDLEKTVEHLRSALREQEQSADKFKEENWNLEVTLQELRTQISDSQATAQRLDGENKRLTRLLTSTRETADQHKTEAERQQTAYEELKAKHETDVAQARKHAASLQRDKSDLQQALDTMKSEMTKGNRRLPRFGSPLTPNGASASEMATPADRDDDDVFSAGGASTHTRKKLDNSGLFPPDFDFAVDESPDPSPSRPFLAPNHPTNEIEALQQRLAHAQRQINTLKSTLQREKELRMDYRRKLEASPGFAIEEEEDVTVEEEADAEKPKARLTPYRTVRGRGRGRGRGGLTLIQRLGMAQHSPASDYSDDVDPDSSPVPAVPSIPAEFLRPDEGMDEEDLDPLASPSPAPPSNRTSVDGMDPAFANVLRRSASAGSIAANGSPLRQSVLARGGRGGTLPRTRRGGGAAYQEARPPSLVGQPEALSAELGFGMMESDSVSTIADDLQQELAAVETVEFGVQTDFEEPPPPPPPVIQIISPSTSEMAIQVDPVPEIVVSTSEVSLQTELEVVPSHSVAEVQTAAPSLTHAEMQTAPEPAPVIPAMVDMDVQTHEVVPPAAMTPAAALAHEVRAADLSRSSSQDSGDLTILAHQSPLNDEAFLAEEDEDDGATETGSVFGETTQTEDFTDAHSIPMTPTDSASDYHSIMTVSDADYSDSGSDDESIKASHLPMSSTSSIPLEASTIAPIPEPEPELAVPKPEYVSKEIETDPVPEPPIVETVDEGIQVDPPEPEPVPEPEPTAPEPEPVVEPVPVPEPAPAPPPEPKPEMKEMSIQTDEWVPPPPPAPVLVPAASPATTPITTPAVVPVPIRTHVPSTSAASSTGSAAAAAVAAAGAAAASVPTVFRVGPSSQQFQFIAPSTASQAASAPTSTPAPATAPSAPVASVAAPSPNTTIRDANATFIARPRTSHSDRRQSIESTLSSVLDDVVIRSRTPSMLPNIDKSRPPMMVLPPPPRQPPPPNSMLPPPFIPDKRMSHDLAPPRPSSPPPPELIQRATTPSLGIPGRGTIGRAHGSSMPPSQHGLRQPPSTSSFRSAANAAARAPLSSMSALSFNLRDRERRELSSASLHSGGHSVHSQRSSISSDQHFEAHLRRHSNVEGPTVQDRATEGLDVRGGNAVSTDPALIHAITQTMIGEFLYKYTRKAIGKGHGERRHKRFFWVHPYTRTLYWSSADPGSSNVTESSAKSAYIESVRAVMDPNPMPPGIHQYSVIVSTPQREMKFTAPTKERHDIWYNALQYLLTRPGQHMMAAGHPGPGPGPTTPMSPMSANGDLADEYPANVMSSPESQRSARTGRTGRSETWNTTPRGQRSRSQISLGGSMGKRSGTPAAEYLRWAEGPSSPTKEYEHIPGGDDGELDFELHDDTLSDEGFAGLENVRACCDGRHTVGRSGRIEHHHHHHNHAHNHAPASQNAQPLRAREQLLDPNAMDMQRPVSPAWSFRSRAGSSTSQHDGGTGFFSRFGTRRSRTVTSTSGHDS
ncbi:hypothetical protein C8Q80DRAFT_1124536 [Daedaleopsis nitida]|nr:hypothetical protein C8Q80DRAFT_1124536 [Daedaleopsis nitida]